jgi:hypothetical protein
MNTPEEFFDNIRIVARRLDVYALADELEKVLDAANVVDKRVPTLLRKMARYEQTLQQIANERVELSHDKIKWQCEDHIRWAKLALSSSGNNAQDVGNTNETLPNEHVAWAIKSDGDFTEIGWDDEVLHEVEEWYTAQGWQYEYVPLYTTPQTKPLSDFEIRGIMAQDECWIGEDCSMPDLIRFARAIEERHGIK